MAFASGFFLQDFVYMALKEYDTMFMGHHVIVLTFLFASHISGTAGRICALGLSMGEATNVAQNTLWACRALSNHSLPQQFSIANSLKRRIVLPVFALAYGFIRLGLSPWASFLVSCLSAAYCAALYVTIGNYFTPRADPADHQGMPIDRWHSQHNLRWARHMPKSGLDRVGTRVVEVHPQNLLAKATLGNENEKWRFGKYGNVKF